MKQFLRTYGIWIFIGLFALLISAGFFYDYGLNTAGDEAPLLSTVLKMISDHTLRPAYPTFYHVALGVYVYLPFVLLWLAALYVLRVCPTVAALKQFVILDYLKLLPLARLITLGVSAASLCFVYLIAEKLFRKRAVSLLAAALTATSLMFSYVSHFARVWPLQIAALLFAFYLIVLFWQRAENALKDYLLVAFGIALATGMHLVGSLVYVSFLVVLVLKYRFKFLAEKKFWLGNALIAVLIGVIAYLNPYGFTRYIGSIIPSFAGSVSSVAGTAPDQVVVAQNQNLPLGAKLAYYLHVLAAYDPLLLLLFLAALVVLWKKERRIFSVTIAFVLVYYFFISFMGSIPRYISPLIPFMSIVAAYGIWSMIEKKASKEKMLWLCLIFILPVASVLALDLWFMLPSTRLTAEAWIYKNIPAQTLIVNMDQYLSLNENKQTEEDMKQYASVFTAKRAYLAGLDPALYPSPSYYLLVVPHYDRLPPAILQKDYQYAIVSFWNLDDLHASLVKLLGLLPHRELVLIHSFPAQPMEAIDIANDAEEPLPYLFSGGQQGPTVLVYKITGETRQ